MKIWIEENKQIVVVHVEGSISQDVVPLFRERLYQLIEEKKCRIVLDMEHASYMSSMALAVVSDIKSRAASLGGDLKLARMNYLVRNLFEITNLLKKLEAYETLDAALAAFEKHVKHVAHHRLKPT